MVRGNVTIIDKLPTNSIGQMNRSLRQQEIKRYQEQLEILKAQEALDEMKMQEMNEEQVAIFDEDNPDIWNLN